jgi:hypothetical protein
MIIGGSSNALITMSEHLLQIQNIRPAVGFNLGRDSVVLFKNALLEVCRASNIIVPNK